MGLPTIRGQGAKIVDVTQTLWSTFGDFAKKEAPQIYGQGGFPMPNISGAESQSRTDTGSPPPVFESGASSSN